MATTDIKRYAHLNEADVEELSRELDAIRSDIEESRGDHDARYIRATIGLQRALAAGGRIALFASRNKVAWVGGTAMLALAKIIENMELGHNITRGQWDWMNDPEIHSTEWEWDTTSPSVHWKKSHNFIHHKYTNVVGLDDDIGYGIMRLTRDHRWQHWMIGNPIYNLALGTLFEWGVALHGVETSKVRNGEKSMAEVRRDLRVIGKKVGKQVGQDYIVFPPLTGRNWKHTLRANIAANLIRNYWSYMVIFAGTSPTAPRNSLVRNSRTRPRPNGICDRCWAQPTFTLARTGIHERQPVLPDRTPFVPRLAEQPLRRDSRARPRVVRQI